MTEILLIFPPDKQTAARQVEVALAEAGYRAVLEPTGEPDGEAIARKASSCTAAMLIWSRPLAASADLGGWLPSLRRLPNLVEVSTDGIAPQTGDERRVVLLSGWRGQPFHLGWRRILEEIESFGARRGVPSRPAPAPAPAAADGPAAMREAGAVARGRRLAIPAAAALAVLGAVGGAAWLGTNAADSPTSTGRPPSSAGAATGRPQVTAPPALAGTEPAALPSSPRPLSGAGALQPDASGGARLASRVQAASKSGPASVRPPAKPRTGAAPPLKRYSRKNSKTMRLFCARSGRSTPQCRIFARSMQAGDS